MTLKINCYLLVVSGHWSIDFGFTILDFGLTPPSSVELGDFRLAILD
jgi:hypothetical protein